MGGRHSRDRSKIKDFDPIDARQYFSGTNQISTNQMQCMNNGSTIMKNKKPEAKLTPEVKLSPEELLMQEEQRLEDARMNQAMILMEQDIDLQRAIVKPNEVHGKNGCYYVVNHLKYFREEINLKSGPSRMVPKTESVKKEPRKPIDNNMLYSMVLQELRKYPQEPKIIVSKISKENNKE